MRAPHDVLVIGAGPAGLSAAAACAQYGLEVAVLAEHHDRPWPQTFGLWVDELAGAPWRDCLAARWPAVAVHLGEDGHRRLQRAYGRVDNGRLQAALTARLERAGARLRTGCAAHAEHGPHGSVVVTRGGERLACRVLIDATGHRPALLATPQRRQPAVQTAYGLVGTFSAPPVPAGTMLLMDYRAPTRGPEEDGGPPSFLYGMPMPEGRYLLEETVLAARPPLPVEVLAARLDRRLAGLGVRVDRRDAVEHVWIPMGGAVPPLGQRVVGFGAAAGMVHPATGYQVGAALARAPRLAAALAAALNRRGATPASVAAAGWAGVWPRDRLRQRALHTLGLEALVTLGPGATRSFFRTFFDLPPDRWSGLLSGDRSAARLAGTMLKVFADAPVEVRRPLLSALARHPRLLGAGLRGSG